MGFWNWVNSHVSLNNGGKNRITCFSYKPCFLNHAVTLTHFTFCAFLLRLLSFWVSTQLLNLVWLFHDPIDCRPPDSSVRWIFQARMLEWSAISSSRWSSPLRDWTHISCISYIAGGFFTTEPWGKATLLRLKWQQILDFSGYFRTS